MNLIVVSERNSVWLEGVVWDHEVAGSSPVTPIRGMDWRWHQPGLISRVTRVRIPLPLLFPSITQLVECPLHTRRVGGSSPPVGTLKNKKMKGIIKMKALVFNSQNIIRIRRSSISRCWSICRVIKYWMSFSKMNGKLGYCR